MSVISCRKSFKKGKPENLLGVREKSIPSEARKVEFSPKKPANRENIDRRKSRSKSKEFFPKIVRSNEGEPMAHAHIW